MCNPDLHFAVGGIVTACAIFGGELLILALGGRLFVRMARWAVREMRSAWDAKPRD